MKPRSTRLGIDQLEDRMCPALTTSLKAGILTISGSADNGSIKVVQETAGTFNILDGTTAATGNPFTGVTSIKLNLTNADDDVTLDLGGQTFSGGIALNLGGGTDSVSVLNGEIGGTLSVNALSNNVGFGGNCGPGGAKGKNSASNTDTGLDTINVEADATVGGVNIKGGQAGSNIQIDGVVTGTVAIDSYFRTGSTAGISVDITGAVDGNVLIAGTEQADTVKISGDIGGSVAAALFGGADSVDLTGFVTNHLLLDTGAGADTINLNGIVGTNSYIDAGAGDDAVTIGSNAQLLGSLALNLGAGADSLTLDDAASIATLIANGGTGTDTFHGTTGRTGVTLRSF